MSTAIRMSTKKKALKHIRGVPRVSPTSFRSTADSWKTFFNGCMHRSLLWTFDDETFAEAQLNFNLGLKLWVAVACTVVTLRRILQWCKTVNTGQHLNNATSCSSVYHPDCVYTGRLRWEEEACLGRQLVVAEGLNIFLFFTVIWQRWQKC